MIREPEWDDVERDKMLDLAEYDARVCECGMHESIADQDPDGELDLRVCPVCASVAKQMRILSARDAEQTKGVHGSATPPPEADLPDDGRHIRLKIRPSRACL